MQRLWYLVCITAFFSACGGSSGTTGDVVNSEGLQDTSTITDTNPPDIAPAIDVPTIPDGGICVPGETQCKGYFIQQVCDADGSTWIDNECPPSQRCDEASAECMDQICEPGEPMGVCITETTYEVCNETGTAGVEAFCEADLPICSEGLCKYKCMPGATACQGFTAIAECNSLGTGYVVNPDFGIGEYCADGDICQDYGGKAKCVLACEADLKSNTYIGCEYWAVDLDNVEGGQAEPVAVVVSNPNEFEEAVVTITNFSTGEMVEIADPNVAPLTQKTFLLPKGFDVDGSGLNSRTFRVQSSAPVVAYQFNPLNAENVWTNDASLLLPSNVAANEFIAMSWPQRPASPIPDTLPKVPMRGFISIIAVEKKPTNVVVYPTADIQPGPGLPTFIPGQATSVLMQYGQVLTLQTGTELAGVDLTGTRIVADRRVSVFAGHECANVPLVLVNGEFKGTEYCDHIEQQMIPLETWGNEYIADAFYPRSPTQSDVWRIMAGSEQIVVSTDPPQAGAHNVTLNQGEFVEIESAENFVIKATGAISVGHYLKSSNYPGHEPNSACAVVIDPTDPNSPVIETSIGDPAFTMSVSTHQFRTDYIVLTPDNYVEHYLNFIYPSGTTIQLDGLDVPLPEAPLGNTTWNVLSLSVVPGVHHITANNPIAVTAYGYDCDVSYAYPGGLNFLSIQ